ncbi:MAG: SDR family NAD(P)-dependent oxidoreductase [Bacteroidota bacterium]
MKKTVLITGSTDGIGKLLAFKLAKEGHKVFVHGRNPQKVNAVIDELKAEVQNSNVQGFVSDFSDLQDVSKMADEINEQIPQLDVLINNAGVFKSPNETNHQGIDIRLVVNYLAPYLLTNLIFPILQKGEKSRIINLSSAAQSPVALRALSGEQKLSVQEAYAQSKLALTMWSSYLAAGQDITVIPVNPGSLLNTKMVQEAYGQYWSSAEKGSDTLYDLAIADEYHSMSGKYFDNDKGKFAPAHSDAYSETKIAELINITKKVLHQYL